MNSGVMLMNLKSLQARDAEFREFMSHRIEELVVDAWDQTAYKLFYPPSFFGLKWKRLPPEYNWKPYRGSFTNAKIIHFHEPKPFQKQLFTLENKSEALAPLVPYINETYFEAVETWERFYAEIESRISPASSPRG